MFSLSMHLKYKVPSTKGFALVASCPVIRRTITVGAWVFGVQHLVTQSVLFEFWGHHGAGFLECRASLLGQRKRSKWRARTTSGREAPCIGVIVHVVQTMSRYKGYTVHTLSLARSLCPPSLPPSLMREQPTHSRTYARTHARTHARTQGTRSPWHGRP